MPTATTTTTTAATTTTTTQPPSFVVKTYQGRYPVYPLTISDAVAYTQGSATLTEILNQILRDISELKAEGAWARNQIYALSALTTTTTTAEVTTTTFTTTTATSEATRTPGAKANNWDEEDITSNLEKSVRDYLSGEII